MLFNTIHHLGYSEKESHVYLALLELGSSPASTVARFIGENRVTVYSVLKVLIKKGIVFESKKNNIQVYIALSPDILTEQEKNKYEQLCESLPAMIALMNPHAQKPKVIFYDGVLGLKSLMMKLIKDFKKNPTMQLHGFLGARTMDSEFEIFLQNTLEKTRQKPAEALTHVILVGDHDYWYANYCREHYITKTVEESTFAMEHEIFTYENNVVILMYHPYEVSGVIIESLSLANGIRSMFDLIWKYAPNIREKK